MFLTWRIACLALVLVAVPIAAEAQRAPIRDPRHIFQERVWSWQELKKQNVVMQERDFSCGAASLSTVLQYFWGDPVTESQILKELLKLLTLNELADRVQNGLTMTDLRRVAVQMGYEAAIGTMEYDKLEESKVPLIVGITVKEYNHFVVYRGTDGEYVYLADPVRGNLRVRVPDFIQQWQKNMVLVVAKPGDVEPPEVAPLSVHPGEWFLGRMNEQVVRRAITRPPLLPPFARRP